MTTTRQLGDRRQRLGVTIALVTAAISGVAVFVNAAAVANFDDPGLYTTVKNLVAAVVLAALAGVAGSRRSGRRLERPPDAATWVALVFVGVVGGGIAFLLFFHGLAAASSAQAAFIHKTLVVWVAVLAVPLLHERIGPWHVAAIGLLVAGQAALAGSVGDLALGRGEALIGAATLLWAAEIVVAKRLLTRISPLTVGTARMTIGLLPLLGYLAVTGRLDTLLTLTSAQWGWTLLTGVILAGYVATWYQALALAPAVDVTAVLIGGALVTAVLDAGVRSVPLAGDALGLAMIAVGIALTLWTARPRVRALPA